MKRGNRLNRWMDTWVGVPVLNLLASLRRRRRWTGGQPQRIGVMCSPALGDTLLFSGALQDLRMAVPRARITHICMPQNDAAAEILPGADERLRVDLTRPWATTRRLRAQRFDVLLDFTSWQRLTACYSLLAGAAYTVGFATAGQSRSRGYDATVVHRDDRHETENFRALLAGSGLALRLPEPHPPRVEVEQVPKEPFADERDLVAFHAWASGQRAHLREWPEERWVALAAKLRRRGTLFLVTGAPQDQPRSEGLVRALRAAGLRAEPLISSDGFRTLTSVLRRCRLVVSVNTGVMHLAAIAGACTVSINGPNRNGRWGPVGPLAIGVEAPGPGCGFLHLGFNFDFNPVDCMERISVEAVWAACRSLETVTGTAVQVSMRGHSLLGEVG